MKAHRRIIDFLGLRRSIVGLLTMVILVGMGEKMAERFLPIYMLALGGRILAVGLLNGLDNLLCRALLVPRRLPQRPVSAPSAPSLCLQPDVDGRLPHRHPVPARGRR